MILFLFVFVCNKNLIQRFASTRRDAEFKNGAGERAHGAGRTSNGQKFRLAFLCFFLISSSLCSRRVDTILLGAAASLHLIFIIFTSFRLLQPSNI